jgi:hypothetical protein
VPAFPALAGRRWALRRLAIVFLILAMIMMGALGWILGRPGVLVGPESQALASPAAGSSGAQAGSSAQSNGAASSMSAPAGHGDANGE